MALLTMLIMVVLGGGLLILGDIVGDNLDKKHGNRVRSHLFAQWGAAVVIVVLGTSVILISRSYHADAKCPIEPLTVETVVSGSSKYGDTIILRTRDSKGKLVVCQTDKGRVITVGEKYLIDGVMY